MDEGMRPLASRHSDSGPFGKLIDPIQVQVSEATRSGLTKLAYLRDESISEYVRRVLDIHVHGQLALMRQSSQKADAVAITAIQRESNDSR